jgi:hypothetical protein
MGEISIEYLDPHFLHVDAANTVEQVIDALAQLPPSMRMSWYFLASLQEGELAVFGVTDFETAAEELGDELWAKPLQDVPGLLVPSPAVERNAMGIGEARNMMRASPTRRLVVLEQGQPVGLLMDRLRAGVFGGFRARLFGEERPKTSISGQIMVRCPVDGESYPLAEVVDLSSDRLVCPNGHVIEG